MQDNVSKIKFGINQPMVNFPGYIYIITLYVFRLISIYYFIQPVEGSDSERIKNPTKVYYWRPQS